jgi:hypothetical protein
LTADTDVGGGGEIKLGKVAAAKNVSVISFSDLFSFITHGKYGFMAQVKKKKRAPKVGYARDEESDVPEPPAPVETTAAPVAAPVAAQPTAAPTPVIPPKTYLQAREEAMQKSRMVGTGISIDLPPSPSSGAGAEEGHDGRTSPSVESEHSEDAEAHDG